jgi:hypothetical protein
LIDTFIDLSELFFVEITIWTLTQKILKKKEFSVL